ncbi:MAG: M81 family metallopeptidase [Alphaproteobacteria bacterium]
MTQRILVAGVWHETNTFSSAATDLAAFRRYQFAEGRDLLDQSAGTNTEVGGFIAESAGLEFDLKPALLAGAVPGGVVTAAALDRIIEATCTRARDLGPVDGALIALHGAMVAENSPDAEAYYLRRLREVVGSRCPIVATFDYHANLSDTLVDACDLMVGYTTYPHVDMADRGREAARALAHLLDTGTRPTKAFRKLPLVSTPLFQDTAQPPMSGIMTRVSELKEGAGVLSASVAAGFPWADVEQLGMAVVAYGAEARVARSVADSLAAEVWAHRDVAVPDLVPVEDAVRQAVASDRGPVVLVDAADNVGGGAPGDGTVVLSALLTARPRSAVVVLHDPSAVELAAQAGVRGRFDGPVGGKTDERHGAPVRLEGRIEFLGDVEYLRDGSYMTGQKVRLGKVAVVDAAGVRVVLTEGRVMPFDTGHLRAAGITPEQQDLIVVKSPVAWRAAFGDMAAAHHVLDTPGICSLDLTTFRYTRRPAGLFPLDPDAAWSPEV